MVRGNFARQRPSYVAVDKLRSFLPAAVLAGALALPCTAQAGSDDMLMPITFGAMGNRDIQASVIGFGIGPHEDRLHMLFHGRAMLSPRLSAGMGGVKGGFAFVERTHVHFGIEIGVGAGGGRIDKRSAGLIATLEPGLFLRLVSEKIGAVHIDGGWMQPLYVKEGRLAGVVMLTLGWSPFYNR